MAPPRRQQRHGGDGGPAAGDADAIDGDGDLAAGDGGSDAADGGDGGPAAAGDDDLAAGDGGSVTGAMEIPMLPTEMLTTTRGTVISPPVTGAMEIPMLPTEGTAVLPLEMPMMPMLSATRGTAISPPVTGAMEIPMLPLEGTAVLPLPMLSTDEGDGDLAAGDGGHGDSDAADGVADAIDESSDLDAIIKSKDQTISLLDKKVRANEEIFVIFKERVKKHLSVISALEKDIDSKNQMIGRLNSWACNTLNREKKSLELTIEKLKEKDNEIVALKEVIESKNLTLQEKDNEIVALKEVIESKNLTLGGFESKIQQLEREYTNSTDVIVRQFNDLVIIGEKRLKEKAKFDDILEGNCQLNRDLDSMRYKLRCLQIRGITLEEEQWRNVFEYEVIITCYAGAYKELKAWFKKGCKEAEEFFKRQHDMIDS